MLCRANNNHENVDNVLPPEYKILCTSASCSGDSPSP